MCAHSLDQALHGAHVAATANSGTKPPHLMPSLLLPLRRQWWRRRRLVVMVMGGLLNMENDKDYEKHNCDINQLEASYAISVDVTEHRCLNTF